MHVMVVTMQVDDTRSTEVDRHLREDVRGWATRQPGFQGGQWIRLPGTDRAFGLVTFESAEQAEASAQGPRAQPRVEGRAWNTESVEVFEVIAQA